MTTKSELIAQVKKALEINLDQTGKVIKGEFLSNPLSLYDAMVEYAVCDKELADMKYDLKQLLAKEENDYRAEKLAANEKVTDKACEAILETFDKIKEARRNIIEKEFELNLLKAKVKSHDRRGEMLYAISQYK